MSTVHFHLEAQFADAVASARFFRAVYAHDGRDAGDSTEELEAMGVDTEGFLGEDVDWELESCGVGEDERFRLDAVAGGEDDVIAALTLAAHGAGASSVLTVLFDTNTGVYQALGVVDGDLTELLTTERNDLVGDDFVAGMRALLVRTHERIGGLIRAGLLADPG